MRAYAHTHTYICNAMRKRWAEEEDGQSVICFITCCRHSQSSAIGGVMMMMTKMTRKMMQKIEWIEEWGRATELISACCLRAANRGHRGKKNKRKFILAANKGSSVWLISTWNTSDGILKLYEGIFPVRKLLFLIMVNLTDPHSRN